MKKQSLTILLSNSYKVLIRLCSLVYKIEGIESATKQFFDLLNKRLKHNGLTHTVKEFKQMRLHITRFLCGQPLLINNLLIGLDNEGFPNRLLFLKPYVNSRNGKRFILTLLMFTRIFKYGDKDDLKFDTSSITDPNKGFKVCNLTIPYFFIKDFVKRNKLRSIDLTFSREDLFLSNKASLNGPSTLTAYNSVRLLSEQQLQYIKGITDLKGSRFIDEFIRVSEKDMPEKNVELNKSNCTLSGKLSLIADPELKVRVIAIFDYFSQVFLKKIHSGLMSHLRSLKQDRTFTQEPRLGNYDSTQKL